MKYHADDSEMFAAMRTKLFTAAVGDIPGTMGFLRQFLPPNIRALRDDFPADKGSLRDRPRGFG